MIPKDQIFRFGPFTFSRARGLWRGTQPIPVRHLERQLLKCLLDRPGELVRKEELMAALWPDSHVAPNTLNVLVRRLRVTLGDRTRPHRLLTSYARIGYLLIASPAPRRVAPVSSRIARGDKSRFVRDVTIPDGSILAPGEPFEKIWEIQNAGSVAWRGRNLRRVGTSSGPGRLVSEPLTAIPPTQPGRLCLIRLALKAPQQPGTYYAAWKMVDEHGREVFPRQQPLFVNIDVVLERE